MGIRPALLDRENRGNAHDRIAQPVGRTNEHTERLRLRRLAGRGLEIDQIATRSLGNHAAPVSGEEEFRLGRLPAIVPPEPVFGAAPHLPFDAQIDRGGQFPGFPAGGLDRRIDHEAPAAGRDRMRPPLASSDAFGAQREGGGERRSGRQPAEERAPDARIARMLIGQDADTKSFPQGLDRRLKPFLALEKPHAPVRSRRADLRINETIAQAC